jgi:hypothetical protein
MTAPGNHASRPAQLLKFENAIRKLVYGIRYTFLRDATNSACRLPLVKQGEPDFRVRAELKIMVGQYSQCGSVSL